MREIKTKEAQQLQLGILRHIKQICDENNLRYYLTYGTLIGAVRHHGFIPWDDDIDVFMPRMDYYTLVNICSECPHEYYKLASYETNKLYTNALPKMIDTRTYLKQNYCYIERVDLGIYVDIFILDGIGTTYEEAFETEVEGIKLEHKWARADRKLFPPNSKSRIKDILRWIRNTPYRIRGIYHYIELINKLGEKWDFDRCAYVSRFCFDYGYSPDEMIWKKEWFEKSLDMEYEGELFRVPQGYDEFLRIMYGDYMKLPPLEKQVSNHDYLAVWRE